jgi:hypothetical protein
MFALAAQKVRMVDVSRPRIETLSQWVDGMGNIRPVKLTAVGLALRFCGVDTLTGHSQLQVANHQAQTTMFPGKTGRLRGSDLRKG